MLAANQSRKPGVDLGNTVLYKISLKVEFPLFAANIERWGITTEKRKRGKRLQTQSRPSR